MRSHFTARKFLFDLRWKDAMRRLGAVHIAAIARTSRCCNKCTCGNVRIIILTSTHLRTPFTGHRRAPHVLSRSARDRRTPHERCGGRGSWRSAVGRGAVSMSRSPAMIPITPRMFQSASHAVLTRPLQVAERRSKVGSGQDWHSTERRGAAAAHLGVSSVVRTGHVGHRPQLGAMLQPQPRSHTTLHQCSARWR